MSRQLPHLSGEETTANLELEAQDRCGYLAQPQREEEFRLWEDAAAWPEL